MITYFVILAFTFQCAVPVVQYLIFQGEYEIYISFSLFTMKNIAAPFIGYWLYTNLDYSKITRKHISLLWLINVASIGLACFMTYFTILNIGTNTSYEVEQFFYNFAPLNAATIFITIKKYYKARNNKINSLISMIAGATFGIYLFHFLSFHLHWFKYSAVLLDFCGLPMVGWFLASAIYFVLNLVFVLILKKCPFIGRYL